MNHRRYLMYLVFAAFSSLAISCNGSIDDITLQGAGATFPAPLYKRWFLEYYKQHPNIRVNYQAIGSGAGIRQFTEGSPSNSPDLRGLVDFGASDAAMSDKEIAKVKDGVQLLPMTAGSVAISYNLPGNPQNLKLSRKALLGILFGEITEWNDAAIAEHNPDVELPNLAITFVRRADGSGTTYVFTNHLSTISSEWKSGPGTGKSVVWPVGVGANGNPGVAALLIQTPGAIGYIESGYAELTHLPMASIENKSGAFVAPTAESSRAALAGAIIPKDLRISVPDPDGKDAYPIVTYTWLLLYKKYKDPKVVAELKNVIRYGLSEGQSFSADLGYVPLPKNVVDKVLEALDAIEP